MPSIVKSLAPLLGLIAFGLTLEVLGIVDWRTVLEALRQLAGWPLAATIVLTQIALFAFGQPGSVMFWVAALVYPPWISTLVLTAGATLGGAAAYLLAYRSLRSRRATLSEHRVIRLIARHSDLLTLSALRLTPGMPHSLLNYGAGILEIPFQRFLAAAVPGLAAKSYLYSIAIHGLVEDPSPQALLRFEVLAPLSAAAALLLLGRLIVERRSARLR